MKKTIALCMSMAVLFCACGNAPSQGLNEDVDVIDDDIAGVWTTAEENSQGDTNIWTTTEPQTEMPPVSEEYEAQYNDGETSDLMEQIKKHLALFEYGKAVQLIEDNQQICADPSFDRVKNEILIHFTKTAKSYLSKTYTFITRQETQGNDVEVMFDESGKLPADNISDLLTEEEKTVINRAAIMRSTSSDYYDVSVSIELFGTYAVYPAQDIILGPVTTPTGEYSDSALLLEEVQKNIGLYRYAAAVQLMEENPDISADTSFDGVRSELLEYFSDKAKLYYTHTATHTVKQEILGYPLTDGCEGYDTGAHILDPVCLSYLLSPAETAVINRVKIVCNNEENYDFKVTIDFCGMTASYPANDVVL